MFDKKIKIALVLSFGLSIVACTDYLDEFQNEYNDAFTVIDNPSSSDEALSSEEGKSSGKKTSSSSEEDDSGKSSGNSSSSAKSGNNLFDDIKCESGDLWCKDSYGLRLATYFKDGKNKSGYWYDYSDKDLGGKSKIIWPVERGSDELDKKFVQYCQGICGTVEIYSGYEYPFAGVGFNIAESAKGSDTPVSVDVSDWGGICVTYLSEIEIKLQQSLGSNLDSALLDFDVPVKKLSKTSSPKEVCLAWTDFNQEGWGEKEKMTGLEVARKLVSLNFKLEGRDGTLADFNIIRLRKNPDGIPSSSVVQSSSSEVLSSSSSKELHSSSSKVQSSSSSTEQSSSSKTIVSDSLGLCYPSDDTIMVGDTIVWYYYGRDIEGEDSYFLKDAGVGGSPRTTFDWAFDGGTPATGRNSSVIDHVNPVATSQRIAYSSAGPKTATVTVTSQNYVGTLKCSDLNVYLPISASCVGETSADMIIWKISSTEGFLYADPSVDYSWTTEGGEPGTNLGYQQYSLYETDGTYSASVTIKANGQTITVECPSVTMSVHGETNSSSSVIPSSSSEESVVDACYDEMPVAAGSFHKVTSPSTSGNIGETSWKYENYLYGNQGNFTMTYYDNGTFKVEWANVSDLISYVGIFNRNAGVDPSTRYYTADYNYKASGSATFSFFGVFGRTENPETEYVIVEGWFNKPPVNDLGSKQGEYTVDGATYEVYARLMQNMQTPTGSSSTVVRFTSIRESRRQCGHVDISAHFDEWNNIFTGQQVTLPGTSGDGNVSLKLGNITEVTLGGEVAGGETGSLEFTYFDVSERDR